MKTNKGIKQFDGKILVTRRSDLRHVPRVASHLPEQNDGDNFSLEPGFST